jgi:hypothetical protein
MSHATAKVTIKAMAGLVNLMVVMGLALFAPAGTLRFVEGWVPVLRALAEGGSLAQKELARLARVEQPTMAEMLARMERDRLVERHPNPDDKRERHGPDFRRPPRFSSRVSVRR